MAEGEEGEEGEEEFWEINWEKLLGGEKEGKAWLRFWFSERKEEEGEEGEEEKGEEEEEEGGAFFERKDLLMGIKEVLFKYCCLEWWEGLLFCK